MACVVLVSHQRSGSTFLRHVLQRNGLIDLEEIFHPDSGRRQHGFLRFLLEMGISGEELVIKNSTVGDGFCDILAGLRNAIVDIKYTDFHHLAGSWCLPAGEPYFLKILKKSNCSVIHLYGVKLFATYLSHRIAEDTRVWHADREEIKREIHMKINCEECEEYMGALACSQKLFRKWLRQHERCVEITYERIADVNSVGGALRQIGELIGVPMYTVESDLIRTRDVFFPNIRNREEVLRYFVGSEFDSLVQETIGV